MKKFSIFYALTYLIGLYALGQDSKVIELDPVEVIPTDQVLVYSNFSKKHRENLTTASGTGVQGKTAIVMGFLSPEKSSIQLEGLEFFFNYDWTEDSAGFYVQPVVVKEKDGLPVGNYVDFPEKYLVTSKLENRLFIDLSSKGIIMEPNERIFIGIKFLENVNSETQNNFNITSISGKIEEYTYILYSDGSKPQEVIGPGKNSAGIKYSVVYKLK